MFPIPTIFGALFTACTETEKESESINPDPVAYDLNECSFDYYTYEYQYKVYVSEEDLKPLLDANGQISEEACATICSETNIIYTCTCEYIKEIDNAFEFQCSTERENFVYEGRGNGNIRKNSTGEGSNPIAIWSARAYHAEASSVAAFLQIRTELDAFGAPQELLDRSLRSACDEVAHAKAMRHICLQHGGSLSKLEFGTLPSRSLFAFAIDNIEEGCVGEAYAAMCVLFQSQNLPPSDIQKLLQKIARDELKHVELAYDIHTWCCSQLSLIEQQVLLVKQRQAFDRLLANISDQTASFLPSPSKHLIENLAMKLCQRLQIQFEAADI